MSKPEVTVVELTSGEIMNLIELIEAHQQSILRRAEDDAANLHLAAYYGSLARQFDRVIDRLNADVVPEQRLAKLVLAL